MTISSQKITELQNNFILNNPSNYKKTLNVHWKEISDKYLEVLTEYSKCINENLQIKKISIPKYKYLFIRGFETITHVFRFLLFYTKNLNMTFYNTQKAFYYYIEFIDQISEEEISYLKLNSNDAILYVYKKTIYQINESFRKNSEELKNEEKKIFEILDLYIYIFKYLMVEFLNDSNYNQDKNISQTLMTYYQKSFNENNNDLKKIILWLKENKWQESSIIG